MEPQSNPPPYATSDPHYPPYPPANAPYPPPGSAPYPPAGGYPQGTPYPPGVPYGQYPVYPNNPPPQQAQPKQTTATVVNQPQPTHTTTTIIIQNNANCPKCHVGTIRESFTMAGICLAFWCFPFGIICCMRMTKKSCNHCGHVVG